MRDARRIHVDEEDREPAARALLGIGRGDELQEVRALRVRDEALVAVDHVMVAVAHRGRAHAARIGAGIGLGLREGGGLLAAQDRIEIALLLLGRQRQQDRAHLRPEDAGSASRQRHGACQLLGHDRDREQAQVLSAELGRRLEQPESKLAGLGFELLADLRLEVRPVHGVHFDRDEFPIDKPPNGLLEHS